MFDHLTFASVDSAVVLQHDQSNPTHRFRARPVVRVDATTERRRAVVVEIVVQVAITGTELLLVEEVRVVEQGECVEYVEVGL